MGNINVTILFNTHGRKQSSDAAFPKVGGIVGVAFPLLLCNFFLPYRSGTLPKALHFFETGFLSSP